MGSNTAGGTAAVQDQAEEGVPMLLPTRVLEVYDSMLANVPESSGDGLTNILEAINRATDPADVDAPWRTSGLEEWLNVPLRIDSIRKAPSDYQGLGWFVIADAVAIPTGELVTITTGAIAVVGQLVKLHALGAFPVTVIPRESERLTKGGFRAQHLEVVPKTAASGS